jgi:hypothetical protein
MKIFVDEHIPLMTVRTLRLMGHDVRDIRGTPLWRVDHAAAPAKSAEDSCTHHAGHVAVSRARMAGAAGKMRDVAQSTWRVRERP